MPGLIDNAELKEPRADSWVLVSALTLVCVPRSSP